MLSNALSDVRKASILVVDDTPENLRLLMEILAARGYDVRLAADGALALQSIRAAPPDLILLDIRMPGMSGYEVCEQVQAEPQTRQIPVIFISGLQEIQAKVKGFVVGGVDYVSKPIQAEEVLARVETHLALAQLRNHLEELVEERTTALRQEIAERTRAEAQVQQSAQQYRRLVEHVTDGIGILQAGRLVLVNAAFAAIFGVTPEHLRGKTPDDVFQGAYKTYFERIGQPPQASHPESSWQVAEFAALGNGREIWMEGRHSVILWESQPAILITLRDVTARKRKEVELTETRKQLRRENIRLRAALKERYRFGDLIGRSPAMQAVYELIAKAAATDAHVVIYGESGTGKDLIAQTIHHLSKRRKKPFVPVNCGSIPENLFESEFFGYRKGAFSGALRDKPGFFDAAQHGILFLDEVGELPLPMQVKMLRAIEGKGYTPVGDQTVKQTDVRIIAATHRNLQELVKQGRMREDFFYRLTVLAITVPPLREHREDLPLLIEHFLARYSPDAAPETLPGNILEVLYNHNWPGNIRQLQNVLQRYVALKSLDFGDNLSAGDGVHLASQVAQGFWLAVAGFEKRLIVDALQQQGGHKTKTAKMLQIPLRTLQRKMQQYHLE